MIEFDAPTIIITSNIDPTEWYPLAPRASRAALNRRLTSVIHMTTPFDFKATILPHVINLDSDSE